MKTAAVHVRRLQARAKRVGTIDDPNTTVPHPLDPTEVKKPRPLLLPSAPMVQLQYERVAREATA
jgi:hypothetical protein